MMYDPFIWTYSRSYLHSSLEELKNEGIGERTIHQVKKQLEIRSVKRDAAWYWLLPESEMSSGR